MAYSQESSVLLFSVPKQEKLYLHLDKPHYIIGDTIWLKGYLVDAATHKASDAESRYIYVELLNRKNKVIFRKKLKEEHGSFFNFIPLAYDLEEADYQVRAYTNRMRNLGEDYFFSKQITVYAGTPSMFETKVKYETNEQGTKYVHITFLKKNGEPYSGNRVEYMIRSREKGNRFHHIRTNAEGEVRMRLPEIKEDIEPYLYLTLYVQGLKYNKRVMLPEEYDYQLSFYPEGGHLIAGARQQVAFKVETSTGRIASVHGHILNQHSDTLATLVSGHAGIGSVFVRASAEDSLRAVVQDTEGTVRSFDLPHATTSHIALMVETCKKDEEDGMQPENQYLRYRLLIPAGQTLQDEYGLLVHTRGQIMTRRILSSQNNEGMVEYSSLPEGITHFVVYGKDSVIVSERLVFVRKPTIHVQMTVNGSARNSRSVVKLGFRMMDKDRFHPLSGDFSVSVTDDAAVGIDSKVDNILTHLLLSSDLKGYVHSPGYYFSDHSEEKKRELDCLLLTHGWSRFDVIAALKGSAVSEDYEVERVQTIHGFVRTHFDNKMLRRFPVNVFYDPPRSEWNILYTDDNGRFCIQHDVPQQKNKLTEFMVRGMGKKQTWRYGVYLEEQQFPEPIHIVWNKEEASGYVHTYIDDLRYGFQLVNGERVYRLPQVEIAALQNLPDTWEPYLHVNTEKVEQYNGKNVLDLLAKLPGTILYEANGHTQVRVFTRDTLSAGGKQLAETAEQRMQVAIKKHNDYFKNYRVVPIIVDGVKVIQTEDLKRLKMSDVKSIDLVRNRTWNPMMTISASELYLRKNKIDYGVAREEYEGTAKSQDEMDNASSSYGDDFSDDIFDFSSDDTDTDSSVENGMMKARWGRGASELVGIYISTYLTKGLVGSSSLHIARIGYLSYAPNAAFYAPKYDVSRNQENSDKRSTIHWEPNVTLNEQGETVLKFYTTDSQATYTVVLEGVTDEGQVCRYVGKIK